MYENYTDHLRNNLKLNEISTLLFLQFYKIIRNQLEIVVKAIYGLHPNKYFKILNLTFWGRTRVKRSFGVHSNSRGVGKIKDLPISIDISNRNTESCYSCFAFYLHACSKNIPSLLTFKHPCLRLCNSQITQKEYGLNNLFIMPVSLTTGQFYRVLIY